MMRDMQELVEMIRHSTKHSNKQVEVLTKRLDEVQQELTELKATLVEDNVILPDGWPT